MFKKIKKEAEKKKEEAEMLGKKAVEKGKITGKKVKDEAEKKIKKK
ncbi:MAG: hypothetical protein ACFFFH_14975 [Candidatus Thorarchaeota archaeon]